MTTFAFDSKEVAIGDESVIYVACVEATRRLYLCRFNAFKLFLGPKLYTKSEEIVFS